MGQALYRKYRSRTLDEVVGQEHITTTLANSLKTGRISHAYLFTGPRGVGKTSVARILAHEINQLPYSDTTHLDIIEIDAASNRRIDDIRDLRDKVHIAPINAKYKVYIIDEVHMLTGESFNALLKTLEEPPSHVIFILATTESHKLPATIISRTQRFSFRPAEQAKLAKVVEHIAQQEKIKISGEALSLIAQHGDGSFRDSISLLDQIANLSSNNITQTDVRAILGLATKDIIDQLTNNLLTGNHLGVAADLKSIEESGQLNLGFNTQLIKHLAALASEHPELYGLIDQLIDSARAYMPSLKLMTVLLKFASTRPVAKTKTVAQNTAPSPTLAAPVKKSLATLKDLTDNDWAKVLQEIKKTNPPLHGVIKHAKAVFNAEEQKLTLNFKYKLHSKKLDDPKQKALLSSVIKTTLNGSPAIVTRIGAEEPDDPLVASVAKIMGGGEIIDV